MKGTPLISVCMITYNHQEFIKEAIHGVCNQKVNFKYELIIANDFSTDNTEAVVKETVINKKNHNPEIHYFNRGKNYGMMENFIFGLKQCKGKYIAFCEGDDFWNNPQKLQKQVDFLEKKTSYGLSYSDFDRYYQEFDKRIPNIRKSKTEHRDNLFEKLFKFNPITTCTVVIRRDIVEKYLDNVGKDALDWRMGDLPLWLFASKNTKVHYYPESTAVYRVLESSATNTSLYGKFKFKMSRYQVLLYFLKKNFSLRLAIIFTKKFLSEISMVLVKIFLEKLNLYRPNKQKLISKYEE